MTSDEIMQVLRLTAMSRVNHPDQQRFCDKLAELFSGWVAPPSCSECVMPSGEHMQFCPNNPLPVDEQEVIGAKIEDGAVVAVKRVLGRRKKAE